MKKTRYARVARYGRAIEELTAEVRALRAEVATLQVSQVQIVPYPYPQPYPVYPQPYTPPLNPCQPWFPYTQIITYGTTTETITLQGANNLSLGANSWDGSTTIALDTTAVGD